MKGTLLFLILLIVSVTHPLYSQNNCFISEFEVVGTYTGVTSYDPETRTATWDFSPIPFLLCGSI